MEAFFASIDNPLEKKYTKRERPLIEIGKWNKNGNARKDEDVMS